MIDHAPAATRVADLLAGTQDNQLADPTPCPDMTVADLIDHISTLSQAFRAKAEKRDAFSGPPPQPDGANLPADWRERVPQELTALAAAWTDPSAWEGTATAGGMEFPTAVIGVITLDELVVHGWDLAVATDQPYAPTDTEVATALEFVSQFHAPRDGSLFGPIVPVPDDAPALDRLIGLAGRNPAWRRP